MTQSTASESQAEPENGQIGSFSGYNRRPIPTQSGMTAQFYGENGEDADMISALSLTKFQETDVNVNVYLVKDANGVLMKSVDGSYPHIAHFTCKVQRPKPQRDGMVAQFFASNGDESDQVNSLGLSKYLDAFVYVEILSTKARSVAPTRIADIDETAKQLTPAERRTNERRSKIYTEAHKHLQMSGFFNQPQVWLALASPFDFENWVLETPCCAPADVQCPHPSTAFHLPGEMGVYQKFAVVPLCAEHAAQALNGTLPGGAALLKMRRQVLIQQWALGILTEKIGIDPAYNQLDPQSVMAWAFENKLTQYVPPNYLAKII